MLSRIWLTHGKTVLPALVALVIGAAVATSQTLTPTGVGGGGFLWSGAFHPTDPDVVLVGGDNCGVFRSDDYGDSWYLWSDGLTTPDEANSFYIEDLIGLEWDGGNSEGFFAATRGGIFYRDAAGASDWHLLTPPESPYNYYYCDYRFGNCGQLVLPFSSLDYDGADSLFAGAGNARFISGEARDGIDLTDCGGGCGNQSGIWSMELSGTPQEGEWNAFSGTSGSEFRDVRDVTAEVIDGELYLAAATDAGLHFYSDTGGWTYDAEPGLDCWSVHITKWGTLYAAFEGEGKLVKRVRDITGTVNWTTAWDTLVGINKIPPACSNFLSAFGNMVYVTVVDAPAAGGKDILYAGGSNQYLGIGLFRAELVGTAALPSNFKWKRWVYPQAGIMRFTENNDYSQCDDDSIGSLANLPVGYIDEFGVGLTSHPVVSPTDPDRVLAQFNARLHLYDATNDMWQQRYTIESQLRMGDPVECPIGPKWMTRGYNQQSVRDIAFRKNAAGPGDSHLLVAYADAAIFINALVGDEFERRNPVRNLANPDTNQVWNWRADNVEYEPESDAMFVCYGGNNKPGRILRWHFATCKWKNVTFEIYDDLGCESDSVFAFADLLLNGADTMYVAYAVYDASLTAEPASEENLVEAGILRGTTSNGWDTWSWNRWNDNLPTTNVDAVRLLRRKTNGYIFMTDVSGLYYNNPASGSWARIFPADGYEDYEEFRSIAQSKDGAVLYAGMRGRAGNGIGGVLKLPRNGDAADPGDWNLKTANNPFGFVNPFNQNWANPGEILTHVRSLAVDPFDENCVFAGLLSLDGAMEQEGLWVFNFHGSGSWERYPAGDPIKGIGVLALGFTRVDLTTKNLYVGSAGRDLYRVPVNKKIVSGPGCPYVYTFDGKDYVEDNTILSAVSAGAAGGQGANVEDTYVLQTPLAEVNGKVRVQIREFEHEHSYIDRVELIAVDHPEATRVAALDDGRLVVHENWALPLSAITSDGEDVLRAVSAWDADKFSGLPGEELDLTYVVPKSKNGAHILTVDDPKEPADPSASGRRPACFPCRVNIPTART